MTRLLAALFLVLLTAAPAMAQRTPVATDPFTSTTNVALGANWTNLNTTDAGSITKQSGVFGGAIANLNPAAAVWVGTGTFTDDQYSVATFVNADFGAEEYGIGVICRASTDTNASRDYYVHYAGSSGVSYLWKVVNGTITELHSGSVAWADGDTVELECEGTTIRAMRNGTALGGSFTATDAALTTGKPGIAAGGDSFVATGDAWTGGNLGGGGGATPGPACRSIGGCIIPGQAIGGQTIR